MTNKKPARLPGICKFRQKTQLSATGNHCAIGTNPFSFYNFVRHHTTYVHAIFFGFLGSLMIFCSFPAIINLAGIGTGLFVYYVIEDEKEKYCQLILSGLFWIASFGIYYFYSLQHYTNHQWLVGFWEQQFMPLQKGLVPMAQWFPVALNWVFWRNLQMPGSLAGFLFVIGMIFLFRENKEYFIFIVSPIILTIILSSFKSYPFGGRVISFLLPAFIIMICYGAEVLMRKLDTTIKKGLIVTLLCFLMFYPLIYTMNQSFEIYGTEEMKPALDYIEKHKMPDDHIVIYYASLPGYRFYAQRYHLTLNPGVILKKDLHHHINTGEQLTALQDHKRLWVIFTHVKFYKGHNKKQIVLDWLNNHGTLMDKHEIKIGNNTAPRVVENNISASTFLYQMEG